MAEIFGYPIMGGGGSDLNFKVIAVASESALPTSAAENTIAVITTAPITHYVFGSTIPPEPWEGMVWFATGTASTVGFNAIKKNSLWVYPTGCQQYVSGEWVSKTAKTYKNGAWTDWNPDIYNGGSDVSMFEVTSGSAAVMSGYVSNLNGGLKFNKGFVNIIDPYDLTQYTTLHVEFTANVTETTSIDFGVTRAATVQSSYLASKNVGAVTANIKKTADLDISNLTGEAYILIRCAWVSDFVVINRVWMTSAAGGVKYLYRHGDLCTALSGGWEQTAAFGYTAASQNSGAVTYNTDNFYCAPTGAPQCAMPNPVNAVDLTDVQTVVIDATVTGNSGGQLCYIMPTKGGVGNNSSVAQIGTSSAQIGVRTEYRIDVSELSGSYYLFVGALATRQARVYQIWLE